MAPRIFTNQEKIVQLIQNARASLNLAIEKLTEPGNLMQLLEQAEDSVDSVISVVEDIFPVSCDERESDYGEIRDILNTPFGQ